MIKLKKKPFVGNRNYKVDFFFTFIYHNIVVLEINKQTILAFIFFFIVYPTVFYVFERLFRPSGTSLNVLKS